MAGEKTEQPTPQRRLKAREQGQVPRSRELSSALATLAALFVMACQIEKVTANWSQYTRHVLALAMTTDLRPETELLPRTVWFALRWSAAPMGAAWLTAAAVSMAQGGLVFSPTSLAFNPSRLSPAAKLKQMFSITGLSALLKSLLPAGFILYLSAQVIMRDWTLLLRGAHWNQRQFASFLMSRIFEISWKGMLIMLIWSALDYLLVRQKHESGLKMSRDELREEMKQTEGNPQIKMRIRRLQRQVRRRKMLQDVQRASVVVSNPTHFAVALQYGPELVAPVVVAKGQNLLAEQIKQAARWHGIAIMENPPLAHALYRSVEIGQPIPAKLYAAVAEILAFVYRMQVQTARAEERSHGR
jgi:flagellar biosynthetic protein FlhB